jgi:hypothetical protein
MPTLGIKFISREGIYFEGMFQYLKELKKLFFNLQHFSKNKWSCCHGVPLPFR